MFEPPEPQSDSESEGIDQPPAHRGPTTDGGGGGGARAIVTLLGPTGQIRVRLHAAPDAGQGFEKADRTNGRPISALC